MRRREFIALVGGAAATWPLAARAQQPTVPVIGFLSAASAEEYTHLVRAFQQGLSDAGYGDGRNVAIEYRWAGGHYDRLPELAAELVRYPVTLIAAFGTAALPAKNATSSIPVVFLTAADPVRTGLVARLNRPGGNVTGVNRMATDLVPKLLELLHEAIPQARLIGFLVNPSSPNMQAQAQEVESAVRSRRFGELITENAVSEHEIDAAFASFAQKRVDAVLIGQDSFFNSRIEQTAALASRHKLPAIYSLREFAAAGGLMSYGASLGDSYRQIGVYAGRVLNGEKPADLPVQQAVRVELVINLTSAKMLGLTFPLSLLGRADEVIE
jgi:putative ABC transport system substrate-binding protein